MFRNAGNILQRDEGIHIDLLTIRLLFFLSGFVVFRMLRVVRVFLLFRDEV